MSRHSLADSHSIPPRTEGDRLIRWIDSLRETWVSPGDTHGPRMKGAQRNGGEGRSRPARVSLVDAKRLVEPNSLFKAAAPRDGLRSIHSAFARKCP